MRNEIPQSQQTMAQPSLNENYINQLKAIMKSKNVQDYLANMAAQNPQLKQIMEFARGGGNLQQVATMMAKQGNIDLNQLINKLMG